MEYENITLVMTGVFEINDRFWTGAEICSVKMFHKLLSNSVLLPFIKPGNVKSLSLVFTYAIKIIIALPANNTGLRLELLYSD